MFTSTISSATKPTLSPAAAAFFTRILEAMQNLEEMGGTDDYDGDMKAISTATVEKKKPEEPLGFSALDDVCHHLQLAREVLSAGDSDALHQATQAEADTRTATYLENLLDA